MAYCQSSLLLRWLHLPDAYCLCVLCMLIFGTAQWVTVLNCVFYDCISSCLQIWEISLYLGRESNKAKVHCVQIIQKQKKKKKKKRSELILMRIRSKAHCVQIFQKQNMLLWADFDENVLLSAANWTFFFSYCSWRIAIAWSFILMLLGTLQLYV